MQRTRRKRKITGSVVDLPAIELSCCLCKTSSGGVLWPLFQESSSQPDPGTIEKIKICIGREISPETDPMARICDECLQDLDFHHSFWKQALQCNDYAQNQMAADEAEVVDAPTEIRVCRFCLKMSRKLVELFPKGEAPNEHQLGKIRECLAVEMNRWDPVTKICPKCVQRIQQFLDFQARHVPVSMFLKTEPSSFQSNEMVKEEVDHDGLDLDLSVSDSDCSIVEPDDKRKDPLSGAKPKLGAMRPEVLELLGTSAEGRNFSVVLQNGEELKVAFEDYQFRFHSMNDCGGSVWHCLEAKLRKCLVKLKIDNEGKAASIISKCSTHVHPIQRPKIMECPLGKGFVQFGGDNEPFWLFNPRPTINNQSRSLIYAGSRYSLYHYSTCNPLSTWRCARRSTGLCMATLQVEGVFQRVNILGKHNHAAMKQAQIDITLKGCPLDLATTEAISEFQKNNPVDAVLLTDPKNKLKDKQQELKDAIKSVLKEKDPDIFKVLQEEDSERNFECVNAGSKLKLKHEGFEYRYFGTQEDESTLWKCIMDSLHHCKIIAKLSGNGKHLEKFTGRHHGHPKEPAAVFGYPLGKRMVGEEPVWMINRFHTYYESRSIIYRDYVFILQDVTKKGITRWGCLSKQNCRASLYVTGDFTDINLRKGHSHEKMPEKIFKQLVEGSSQPLSPEENLSFKQRLLAFPSMSGKIWDEVRNEHETFYVLDKLRSGAMIGYGLIYRKYKYRFCSLDQYGTSRWGCLKQETCPVLAIVEGIYETICIKGEHNHEMLPDSEINLLMKRSTSNTLSEATEDSCLVQHAAKNHESKNVLSILARQDPDRNFLVSRFKTKLLIHFEEEDFRRMGESKPDGTSLWCCTWQKQRYCPVVLCLSADGKQVTIVDPKMTHNHSEEQLALFYLALGKASVYDGDICANRFYWLYSFVNEYRTSRAIIYQGYKYSLCRIRNKGLSTWKCYARNCGVFANVEDCLKKISLNKKHNHGPLPTEEILTLTGLPKMDPDLLPDGRTFESVSVTSTEGPLHPSVLFRLLSTHDSERNFQVSTNTERIETMTIFQDGHEYAYRSSNETHTLWKCIYARIRHCRALLHVDNLCKHGSLPKFPRHNHPNGKWGILNCPQGKNTIMDSYTDTVKPFWFLIQPGKIRPCPILIYDQHKYLLVFLTANGDNSKWRCAGVSCPVHLTVTGMFELIVDNGSQHNHELPSEEKFATWMQNLEKGVAADGEQDADDEFDNQISFVEVPVDVNTMKCEEL